MSEVKLHKVPRRWPLVLIALDKFVKAAGLAVISFFIAPHRNHQLQDWIDATQLRPHGWLVSNALEGMEKALSVGKEPTARVFVFIFIGLYLIEGVGLIYEKKWAEWMIVVGTVLFLPLEVIEYCKEPRWSMVVVFVVNVFIALYLVWRMHRQHVVERERAALAGAGGEKTQSFPVAPGAQGSAKVAEPAKVEPARAAETLKPESTKPEPNKVTEPAKPAAPPKIVAPKVVAGE